MLESMCLNDNSSARSAHVCSTMQSAVEVISHGRHAHRASQPIITETLSALCMLMRALRSSGPGLSTLTRAVSILASADMTGLLLNNVFANSASSPPSRAATAAVFSESVELCGALRRALANEAAAAAPARGVHGCAQQSPDDYVGASAAAGSDSGAARALDSMQPGLCALLQAIVRTVGMPQQHAEPAGAQGRHVLRLSLMNLRGICRALPCPVWSR
jgi:hypothetical protein